MLDAHLSHIKIVGDLMLTGKIPAALAVLRGLDVLIGDKMIHDQRDLILVEHTLLIHLLHLVDRHRGRDIIAQHQI